MSKQSICQKIKQEYQEVLDLAKELKDLINQEGINLNLILQKREELIKKKKN